MATNITCVYTKNADKEFTIEGDTIAEVLEVIKKIKEEKNDN